MVEVETGKEHRVFSHLHIKEKHITNVQMLARLVIHMDGVTL